jgi:hypothetical protein
MASLRMKSFEVKVFLSASLLDVEPDFVEGAFALTEVSAIQYVLGRCSVSEAGVVYVAGPDGQERWLYGVSFVDDELVYEHVV